MYGAMVVKWLTVKSRLFHTLKTMRKQHEMYKHVLNKLITHPKYLQTYRALMESLMDY